MSKLYLQNIVVDISFENLPAKWQGFDFARFSKNKTLFDFQKDALRNALKALYLYYKDKKADKKALFEHYKLNGFEENFDYDLTKKQNSKTTKYLLEYSQDYPVIDNKISFSHFINRMSFWMATGSGKTLIIIKLIEFLGKLIVEKELPSGDILFLAHRDDLLNQFKNHIDEFNSFNFDIKINLKNLRDYENVKRENTLPFAKNEITVFYYRSDLISDEHKEKIVNFRNYDNGGRWYILLDEAHKGDKEDSKRQILYSILSRNGFLFNFSATFTDPKDFVTCAFNFNLSKFVEEGYGKHIYVSGQDVAVFRREIDFSKQEKQKIVLKVLLLQTYINKNFEKIREIDEKLYHRPLLLTLVNSVNKPDADLKLFFKELENIATAEPAERVLKSAKDELIAELCKNPPFYFEENEKVILNIKELEKISYKEILEYVFNTRTPGAIEVSFRPSDKSQVALKLATSDRYFALIKTGEMPQWLKDELNRFNINHRFENEGFFETLNRDDSQINILMGSRSFYEGWDSNRPNILLFINIGVGNDAKKFVLQSVGRGVRIEPQKYKRKRLQNLFNAKEVDEQLFERIKDFILPIESLFIFGTNAKNLKEIIAVMETQKTEGKDLGEMFIINPEAQKYLLLIPVYKTTDRIFAEESNSQKYSISKDDFEITSKFYNYLGDKIALIKYDCEVKILKKVRESFSKKEQCYDFSESNSLFEPELILGRIFDYFGVKSKEFDKFKELENEIVHFKKIRFSDGEKYEEIKQKIEEVKNTPKRKNELRKLFEKGDQEKYDHQLKLFENAGNFEMKNQKIKIKYLANHYYLPVILSETEKIDYLNHIINIESEVKFVEELEQNLDKLDNLFDWWMFSKIDQTLDEVFIPYYNPKENNIANFKPDFIFWAQRGNRYWIVFIDPKGTEHTDGYRKIDGYSKIFEIEKDGRKQSKDFSYNGFTINIKLLLKPKRGIKDVLENYKQYWFADFIDFVDKIS